MNPSELLDEGIRAYTRGDFAAAERCWTAVLALEPGHARARSYLELLGARAARHLPAARRGVAPEPASGARPDRDAVPAPAPRPSEAAGGGTGPEWWLQPPTSSALDERPPPRPGARRAAPPVTAEPSPLAEPARAAPTRTAPVDGTSAWDQGPALGEPVVVGEGDGLDLATVADKPEPRPLVPESARDPVSRRPRSEVEVWMEGARELFALGDFSGSLEMIEKILRIDPGHAEAREYLKQNEATLIAMYESKLGPAESVPRLAIEPEEVMWLNLDHRAGFLLAQIDGTVSYEELFAVSGLPRLDTARILAALLNEGVIRSS